MNILEQFLADGAATERLGAALARGALPGTVLFLFGELGAGKTTLVRGFLHALGHRGAVKSPTYTLVEPYDLGGRRYYHFDLYRLGASEELEYLGVRDYFDGAAVALVEWPQRGTGMLPAADLAIHLEYREEGRLARLHPLTPRGEALLTFLTQHQNS
ncbi:MAG TPA: tRNA (adenosine(37)-N6)-threonylcarbamoyltransferase complex ATPase subunit type 1 TsaE [Gammaproteobacteria bacterium]